MHAGNESIVGEITRWSPLEQDALQVDTCLAPAQCMQAQGVWARPRDAEIWCRNDWQCTLAWSLALVRGHNTDVVLFKGRGSQVFSSLDCKPCAAHKCLHAKEGPLIHL